VQHDKKLRLHITIVNSATAGFHYNGMLRTVDDDIRNITTH